ncbi:MAG TPA: hypothetical protein VH442_17065, partial [Micromonosporaceae bacterium]
MTVLVAVLIAVVITFAAIAAGGRFLRAQHATQIEHAMTVATDVGGVLQRMEAEQLAAVGFLLHAQTEADFDARANAVTDRVTDVKAKLGAGLPAQVRNAIDDATALAPVRSDIATGRETPAAAVAAYGSAIDSIISSLSLARYADATTTAGRQVLALDVLLTIDARHAESASDLLIAAVQKTDASAVDYAAARQAAAALEARFMTYASRAQVALYGTVTAASAERVGGDFVSAFAKSPRDAASSLGPLTALYPRLQSYVALGQLVEAKIAADVSAAMHSEQRGNLIAGYVIAGVALLVVLLMILASWLVIR